jgi:hypothetical protein
MENRKPRSSASALKSGNFAKGFRTLASVVALGGLVGCAAPDEPIEAVSQPGLSFNGLSFNGLSFNGLSFNGLSFNGLSFNGLSFNGLSFNGLSFNGAGSPDFANWFNLADGGDMVLHDMTMKYVIRCAIAQGRTASFTDRNGVVHSWPGSLGLADSWDQNPPTDDQKKWVSACLMAHVNSALPAPKSIQLSVRGAASSLVETMIEKGAVATFDGVFFGDLFGSPSKRYICSPTWSAPINYTTTLLADWGRQCFFSPDGCGGMFTPVDCTTSCTAATGTDYQFGPTCTAGGVTYNAINAYVPRFKKARDWTMSNTQLVTCPSCFDGKYIDNFNSTSYAQVSAWTSNGAGGAVYLDVRYQNATAAAQNLRVQVNGAFVMNAGSQNWSFPVTGSAWAVRSIPVTLPAGGMVKLMGPTSGKGPKVEVVSLRAQ